MSFKENAYQQMSFTDSFSVLYSDKASRPNSPVNASIAKRMGISGKVRRMDSMMIESPKWSGNYSVKYP